MEKCIKIIMLNRVCFLPIIYVLCLKLIYRFTNLFIHEIEIIKVTRTDIEFVKEVF